MKIQTKVTILFIALTSAVILLLSIFIFFFANHFVFEDFYERLETRLRIAESIHYHRGNQNSHDARRLKKLYLEKLNSEQEFYITWNKNSERVFDSLHLPQDLLKEVVALGKARFQQDNHFYVATLHKSSLPVTIVIVTAKDPYGLEELQHLRTILFAGIALSILLVYVIGKIFVNQTFRPFRELVNKVKNISAENLSLRLDVNDGGDEINKLRSTFNEMLTRLETTFKIQNNFVSNASHELRTPLTIIRGEAELAFRRSDPETWQQESFKRILEESEKLTSMITSLLGLAQTGFDGKKQHWSLVRMDEVVLLAKEAVDKVYPFNKVTINFDELPEEEKLLQVHGNETLLKLAVSNVLLNACKYSNNNVVLVSLFSEQHKVNIHIKDKGIGIPQEETNQIFEPFFRASNTTGFTGHGVGLPLALNIVKLHKGNIAVNTTVGTGTEIILTLPVA